MIIINCHYKLIRMNNNYYYYLSNIILKCQLLNY